MQSIRWILALFLRQVWIANRGYIFNLLILYVMFRGSPFTFTYTLSLEIETIIIIFSSTVHLPNTAQTSKPASKSIRHVLNSLH